MEQVYMIEDVDSLHDNGHDGKQDDLFAQLLDEYEYPQPQRGDILRGSVLRIKDDVLYVDVGAKRDALVPYEEVIGLGDELLNSITTGDEVPVYVTRTPIGDEQLVVSLERGLESRDWERAERLMAEDETVELEIIGHNKGGLIVQFGRIRGFVPNSHEPELRRLHDRSERTSYKSRQLGDTLPLKIIEINRDRERLVLSATAAQKELRQEQLEDLQEGQIVTGEVVHMTDYGAFVDLGHVTGLLHISKIAWEHIDDPADVFEVGDKVEVRIDSIDEKRERISLNRRDLLPSPWQSFADEHEPGELIEGAVTAVTDFGAFILVSEGVEGLVHVSEMNIPHGSHPEVALQPGDIILARILSIEPDRERLGLSIRRVSAEEEMNWMVQQQEQRQQEALAGV